jgi:MarR family transcriptional regulator, organic hydroperoxide resistance regulator
MSKPTKGPFSVARAEDSSGFLLWQVVSLWQRGISRELAPLGLSHAQFVALAGLSWLRLHQDLVSQRELAAHVKMDAMTASSVLRKLETMGYVDRQASKTDSRARSLRVTPAGKAIAGKAIRAVEQFDREFFAHLGKDLPRFAKDMLTLLRGHASATP